MKSFYNIFLLIFFTAFTFLSAKEVVATVNGEEITQEDVNAYVVKSIPGATFTLLTDEQKKSVIQQMINRKLYLEDAKAIHLENDPEFLLELKKVAENLMLDFWMKRKVEEIEISDAQAKAYYKENSQKFMRPEAVKVRHILLATNMEAQEIILELKKEKKGLKKRFIKFAKDDSTGPSSINGGELDWFARGQMVPEFTEAAFALKKGHITQTPVKTQFGYHIIYLENKREKGTIPFEMVKEDIVKSLRIMKFKTKLEKLSKKLKKSADISVK